MQTPSTFMDYLTVQSLIEYGGLAVFPLTLVDSAFEATDQVGVIGCGHHGDDIKAMETGQMNSVRIENRGTLPVLISDGTILIGGAANRMLTESAVIQKDDVANLPVVSVETKRWDCEELENSKSRITADDPAFSSSIFAPASLRRVRLERSILTMKKEGITRVSQDMIWKHIMNLFEKSTLLSKNFDVCELYKHWDYLLDEYISNIKSENMQVGCIVFIDRNTWYLDVFYNSTSFNALFPNLLKSYAMEAIMARIGLTGDEYHWVPELSDAQDAFAMIKLIKFNSLKATAQNSDELGFFASRRACGVALAQGSKLMHMAVCSRGIPVIRTSRAKTQNASSGS